MTPEEITHALAELREAGEKLRRRPARDTLDALAALLESWRDPTSPWRRALEAALPAVTGFSPAMLKDALALGLEPWTGDALLETFARECGTEADWVAGFDTSAVLLAGSLPLPTLPAVIAPLALRSPVLVKSAARDPVTAPLVAESLAAIDPELGRCMRTVAFPGSDEACTRALLEADCVVANGSDATMAAVAARVHPPRRFVPYGHRLSVAALGPDATGGSALAAAAGALSRDVALWDQLGCLSPITVLVSSSDPAGCPAVAEALADALADVEQCWPRGEVEAATAAVIAEERSLAEMRAATGKAVHLHAGAAWTVVCEDNAALRPAPLHRFVRVQPVRDEAALLEALRPLGPHLAAVALAGFSDRTDAMARALARLGASRVCPPGALQTPPLAWRRDNRGVFLPLARLTEIEL